MLDFENWNKEDFENYYGKEGSKRLYQCLKKIYEPKVNFFNDEEFNV